MNSHICQLRLDFDHFDLTDNVVGGVCTDSFDVTVGSSRDYYSLCGTNSGYHGKFCFTESKFIRYLNMCCVQCSALYILHRVAVFLVKIRN